MLFCLDISNGKEKYPVPIDQDQSVNAQSWWNFRNFQYVKTNVPGPGCNRELLSEQFVGCTCEGQCLPDTCSCLQNFGCAYESNGMLKESYATQIISRPILECGNECTCPKTVCGNRVVQNGASTKFCIFSSSEKGLGLKIMAPLRKYSFVCEYAGEIVNRAEAKKRVYESDSSGESNYLICLKEHTKDAHLCTFVDPKHVGNFGRFINHSCDPNLVMLPVRVNHSIPRLALFSRQNLDPGEELTFDYSGSATFIPASECLSGTFTQECQHATLNAATCTVSWDAEKSSISDKQRHPKLHGVSKSIPKKPLKRKQAMKLEEIVSTECLGPKCKDNPTSTKIRKPCFCKSKNCQRFLPLDSF